MQFTTLSSITRRKNEKTRRAFDAADCKHSLAYETEKRRVVLRPPVAAAAHPCAYFRKIVSNLSQQDENLGLEYSSAEQNPEHCYWQAVGTVAAASHRGELSA